VLGLPPLSQYDAGAMPLFPAFVSRADTAAFAALPARWPLEEMNPPGRSALRPADFRRPDFADEEVLNREIWTSVRSTPMPAARHSAMIVQRDR